MAFRSAAHAVRVGDRKHWMGGAFYLCGKHLETPVCFGWKCVLLGDLVPEVSPSVRSANIHEAAAVGGSSAREGPRDEIGARPVTARPARSQPGLGRF